jgi:excisionase family DNA binding protein
MYTSYPNVTTDADKPREMEYCTVREAARLLKVSPATIWRWIEAGKLRAYRVGPKNIRIGKRDLESMIKPARAREMGVEGKKERSAIWAGYDPGKVRETIEKTAGSWADLDAEALIAELYRGREEGSRPESRP